MIRPTRWMALLALLLPCCNAPEEPASESDLEELSEQLEALGYVNWVPVDDPAKSGVGHFDRAAAWPGINLFNSRNRSAAVLMSLEGRELHRWASELHGKTHALFLERMPTYMPGYMNGWNRIELLEDGGLLVIGSHHMLLRLDWSSRLVWKLDISAHHDLSVAPDGRIYVLTDSIRTIEPHGVPVTLQDNQVVVVSPDGRVERTISILDALRDAPEWELPLERSFSRIRRAREATIQWFQRRIQKGDPAASKALRLYTSRTDRSVLDEDQGIRNVLFHDRAEDLLHTNSVQVLERGQPGLWRPGDLLLSIRELDTVAVMDHDSGRLVWHWGSGELERQHHATQLQDGTILLFDNGVDREWSRIVRMDPATGKIVWQYRADPPESFFSERRGGAQQLPNGNVLIAETDTGRVFEVTPEGETVWEYHNEVMEQVGGETKRGAIYRMMRFEAAALEPLLGGEAGAAAP